MSKGISKIPTYHLLTKYNRQTSGLVFSVSAQNTKLWTYHPFGMKKFQIIRLFSFPALHLFGGTICVYPRIITMTCDERWSGHLVWGTWVTPIKNFPIWENIFLFTIQRPLPDGRWGVKHWENVDPTILAQW